VSRRASPRRWRSVGTRWRICVKDTVVADATAHFDTGAGEVVSDGDRVTTRVADEQRHFAALGQEFDDTADLRDGRIRRVRPRRDASHVHWRRPTIRRPVELADPLVVPARHDRLTGRVLGGRIVEAPLELHSASQRSKVDASTAKTIGQLLGRLSTSRRRRRPSSIRPLLSAL